MRFSIRAGFAAVFLAAVAAVFVNRDATPIASLPPFLWVLGVALGAISARGRGLRCIISSVIGGALGAAAACGCIVISDQMAFPVWYSPLLVMALCGLGGGLLGIVIRIIIEGLTLRRRPPAANRVR